MSFFDPHSSARASTMPVHTHARVSSDSLLFLRTHASHDASVICVGHVLCVCVCVCVCVLATLTHLLCLRCRVCTPRKMCMHAPLAKFSLTRTVRTSRLLDCAHVCDKCSSTSESSDVVFACVDITCKTLRNVFSVRMCANFA
jgi:hypothetical protein